MPAPACGDTAYRKASVQSSKLEESTLALSSALQTSVYHVKGDHRSESLDRAGTETSR